MMQFNLRIMLTCPLDVFFFCHCWQLDNVSWVNSDFLCGDEGGLSEKSKSWQKSEDFMSHLYAASKRVNESYLLLPERIQIRFKRKVTGKNSWLSSQTSRLSHSLTHFDHSVVHYLVEVLCLVRILQWIQPGGQRWLQAKGRAPWHSFILRQSTVPFICAGNHWNWSRNRPQRPTMQHSDTGRYSFIFYYVWPSSTWECHQVGCETDWLMCLVT